MINNQPTENMFKQIIIGILIAGCSASLGYGYSQSTMGTDVRAHTIQLADLKEMVTITNNRLDKQAVALEGMMDLNKRLVTLIEVQKQLNGK
jgi:hypothetical protein